jgi:phosphoglycolate phosphatase-like HAD superfamily hydrolase
MGPAIIWDFDGTLVDTYPAIARAYAVALATFGAEAPFERIVELSSYRLDRCTRQLAADYGLVVADLEVPFQRAYSQITSADQPPFPGVPAVCEALQKAGWRQFIVTHRRRASLDALLAAHGFARFIDDIIAGDDGFSRKPDPAGVDRA